MTNRETENVEARTNERPFLSFGRCGLMLLLLIGAGGLVVITRPLQVRIAEETYQQIKYGMKGAGRSYSWRPTGRLLPSQT